jgi:hypothetical protein
MCLEGVERVEVGKYLGLGLLFDLRWRMFVAFAMCLKFFVKEK